MPSSNRNTLTVPASPWGLAWLLNPDASAGLDDLGCTAYTKTLPVAADAKALKSLCHTDHVVDVRDYGAVGNGVADDTVAIRAAYAAAVAAVSSHQSAGVGLWNHSRATLYFPRGKYLLSGSITNGVACSFIRFAGEDSILILGAGFYALDCGPYTTIEALVFHDGDYALKITSGALESRILIDRCKMFGQTIAAIWEDNTCGNGTFVYVRGCRIVNPAGAQVLHADSGDWTIFRDSWIYGNRPAGPVFDATCTLSVDHCMLNPNGAVQAWFAQRANLQIKDCRFGGENNVDALVECHTGPGAFPAGPETELTIRDCSIYLPGTSPVVKFYAIPNSVQIIGNTGLTGTDPFWFDAGIAAADIANVGSFDSTWEVRDNCWPLYEQIVTGPAAARKGIMWAQSRHRRHQLAEFDAGDYLRNIGPLNGGYGLAVVTNCGTVTDVADEEDPAINDRRYAATADGQYFTLGYTTLLDGLAAGIMTAIITAKIETDYPVELQVTAHNAVMTRLVGPGRHTLSLPFYYVAAAPTGVELAAYNMQNGSSVLIERFQIIEGESTVRGKRADLVGMAAPVAGDWLRGDRLRVLAPALGSAREWVCTTGGTPGTWQAEGLVGNGKAVTHDYAGAAVAWSISVDDARGTLFTVTNANGAADAVFPAAIAGKMFTVYNNSGQAITFKVNGQAGAATVNMKRSIWVMDATDCRKIYEQP